MYYDPFVLPFTIGLNILLIYLVIKYARWIRTFSPEDKRTIRRNFFSLKTLKAGKEVFLEVLYIIKSSAPILFWDICTCVSD